MVMTAEAIAICLFFWRKKTKTNERHGEKVEFGKVEKNFRKDLGLQINKVNLLSL
jgi:hypothetical protein